MKHLTQKDAIRLVQGSLPFKADFALWLEEQIVSDLDNEILSADVNPVKVPAELSASLNGENVKLSLRFADSLGGDYDDSRTFKLKKSCDCALVLVVSPTSQRWTVNLSFSSNKEGEVLRLSENVAEDRQPRKRIYIWRFKAIRHCKMVGWYDPSQLARTAVDVVISTLFGRHADYRLMEALATSGDTEAHDYTRHWKVGLEDRDIPDSLGNPREDIWLDYVGDVGDGWDSTYAVAHCLAQPELRVSNPYDHTTCITKRGDILVFGGDQVYPVADRKQYRERLSQPYEAAMCRTDSPHPHAYAIPGNHDWYDSLVSFTRLFCQKRWFGGWQTNQSRSYFALKLPGRWWLLGTDVQLDSDIDVQQVNFFRGVAKKMELGDRVIICTAEPHWVYAAAYGKDDSNFNENNLAFLEKRVIGGQAKVAAFIAGDEHHYRRYGAEDGTQKITAGGGGAFLHPTHGREATELPGGYKLKECFPRRNDSKKLTWRNLLFAARNPWFGILTAVLYVLTAWAAKTDVSRITNIFEAMGAAINTLKTPSALFWVLAMVGAFAMFTDTHVRWYRIVGGVLHGFAHLVATFFIGWGAARLGYALDLPFDSWGQLLLSGSILFVLGWIIGSTILGAYLFISLTFFGRHANEAFSSLSIPDYKNFLRMRIEANGDLTVFPIGLRRVPRKWKRQANGAGGPAYIPNDKRASLPELIDTPLYFKCSEAPIGTLKVSASAERCLKREPTVQ